jgi:hypothetical protein
VLDDALDRLQNLDTTVDGPAVARALALDLGGRDRPLHGRTDPLVAAVRAGLVDLVVQPRQLTRRGRPSAAAQRRARRCRLSFDEGYLVGRIGLDTHRLPLLWSGLSVADAAVLVTPASDGGDGEPEQRAHGGGPIGAGPIDAGLAGARLAGLRSLVLNPALAAAYAGSRHLAPLLRDLTEETRGIPSDQAAQFAAFGLLTTVAEWTLLVGGHAHRPELAPAGC